MIGHAVFLAPEVGFDLLDRGVLEARADVRVTEVADRVELWLGPERGRDVGLRLVDAEARVFARPAFEVSLVIRTDEHWGIPFRT